MMSRIVSIRRPSESWLRAVYHTGRKRRKRPPRAPTVDDHVVPTLHRAELPTRDEEHFPEAAQKRIRARERDEIVCAAFVQVRRQPRLLCGEGGDFRRDKPGQVQERTVGEV